MSSLKRLAEGVITASGVTRLARRLHRSDAVILAYHNVIPDGLGHLGDSSLHLHRSAFRAQLDLLSATHDVVPLGRILQGPERRDPHPRSERQSRPLAAITFDDAYRGAMTIGLEELEERSLPATVFVAPGLLGDRATWWDLLADPETRAPPSQVRERALQECKGIQEDVLAMCEGATSRPALPSPARTVTLEELQQISSRRNLTVGSHTWDHANLGSLSQHEIESQYLRAQEWLNARFDQFMPWLAYPYGLTSPLAEALASEVYEFSLRLGGGYAPAPPSAADRQRVPRVNIPGGVSLNGFELRVSGVIRR